MKIIKKATWCILVSAILTACGGGGGGDTNTNTGGDTNIENANWDNAQWDKATWK